MKKYSLPLYRVAPGGLHKVTVISDELVVTHTHWLGRSKHLCMSLAGSDECRGCVIDEPRCHVLMLVRDDDRDRDFLLELTESSYIAQRRLFSTLGADHIKAGDQLHLSRKLRTSPVRVEVVGRDDHRGNHPHLTTLRSVSALYKLALPEPFERPEDFFGRQRDRIDHQLKMAIKDASALIV